MTAEPSPRRYAFSARLERVERGVPFYSIAIPASVSKAIGVRGNVPIIADVNGVAEVRASLVPSGGGRHRLHLNGEARRLAKVGVGDRVAVVLVVDESPTVSEIPEDLARALREEGALEAFQRFAVGKQNHILHWVDQAVHETTREKRIAQTVEVALAAREKALDRALARGKPRVAGGSRR